MYNCIEIITLVILSLNPKISEHRANRFSVPICNESEKNNIDPRLVVAMIHHESNWSTRSVMRNGIKSVDLGVMQFNCRLDLSSIYLKWRKWWCHKKRRKLLKSVEGGIKAGIKELTFWRKVCDKKHHNTKEHWWVQHYNWNSRFYSRRIQYIYLAIYKNREDIYCIVRERRYTRFKNLDKCLKDENMCLGEYEEWQRKKKQRKPKRKKLKEKL